jgi:hypothetical protein
VNDVAGIIVLVILAAFVVTYSLALVVLLVGLVLLVGIVLTPFVILAAIRQRKAEQSKPTP